MHFVLEQDLDQVLREYLSHNFEAAQLLVLHKEARQNSAVPGAGSSLWQVLGGEAAEPSTQLPIMVESSQLQLPATEDGAAPDSELKASASLGDAFSPPAGNLQVQFATAMLPQLLYRG